ncbi:MAG: HD domain-containing protein [Sedimentisphaerales bacterium]|nr:HD domain-containing protein [Sedimentisphaerales bacterium]
MPIILKVNELEPGMVLAANIMNEFSVLLAHGRKLNEMDIRSLERKFPDLMVQVIDPVLDDMVTFDDDRHDQEVSREVRRNVAGVIQKVSHIVRGGVALTGENVAGMQQVIEEMMRYLEENPVTMAILEQSQNWSGYLQEHSANVFYLSLVIGNTIRNYIRQERQRLSAASMIHNAMNLAPLATAAMFHDIGMAPIEHFYQKEGPLSDQEKELIRAHPVRGAEMLPEEMDPMIRLVVRSHHENQDGSGYPDQIPGDRINIFARIVRLADAYVAATATKVYQKAKSPICVLYEMLYGAYRNLYDPVLLKVFSSVTQPLPIGAKIKLESGQWAVVVSHNRHNPFSPQVIVAFDEWGDPLRKEDLKPPFYLGERDDVRVLSFGQEDLRFLNDLGAPPDTPSSDRVVSVCADMLDFCYP